MLASTLLLLETHKLSRRELMLLTTDLSTLRLYVHRSLAKFSKNSWLNTKTTRRYIAGSLHQRQSSTSLMTCSQWVFFLKKRSCFLHVSPSLPSYLPVLLPLLLSKHLEYCSAWIALTTAVQGILMCLCMCIRMLAQWKGRKRLLNWPVRFTKTCWINFLGLVLVR